MSLAIWQQVIPPPEMLEKFCILRKPEMKFANPNHSRRARRSCKMRWGKAGPCRIGARTGGGDKIPHQGPLEQLV